MTETIIVPSVAFCRKQGLVSTIASAAIVMEEVSFLDFFRILIFVLWLCILEDFFRRGWFCNLFMKPGHTIFLWIYCAFGLLGKIQKGGVQSYC